MPIEIIMIFVVALSVGALLALAFWVDGKRVRVQKNWIDHEDKLVEIHMMDLDSEYEELCSRG
jgi:hypothetical protein